MRERSFEAWLERVGAQIKKATGSDTARVQVGDGSDWTSREVSISLAGDSLLFSMTGSEGRDGNLEDLNNMVILRERGAQVVRVDLLRYFPGLYLGGDIKYSPDGEPSSGCLVVELDFDVDNRGDCLSVTRDFAEGQTPKDYWSSAMDAESRKRVVLPEGWTRGKGKLVYAVLVKDSDGQLVEHNLEFPERVSIEMIMEASRREKGGLLSE